MSKVDENRLLKGANPVGVVAAAFYLASVFRGVRVTQKDVAMVAGVSEVTVRVDSRAIRSYSEFQCEL